MMSNDKKEFVRRAGAEVPAMGEATTAIRFILTMHADDLKEIKRNTLYNEREYGFAVLHDKEAETVRTIMLEGERGSINLTDYNLQDNEIPLFTVHTHWTKERATDWRRDLSGPAFPQDGDVMTHFERLEKLGPAFGVMAVNDDRPPSLIVYTLCEDGAFTCAQAMHDAFTDGQHEMHYRKLMELYTAWTLTP